MCCFTVPARSGRVQVAGNTSYSRAVRLLALPCSMARVMWHIGAEAYPNIQNFTLLMLLLRCCCNSHIPTLVVLLLPCAPASLQLMSTCRGQPQRGSMQQLVFRVSAVHASSSSGSAGSGSGSGEGSLMPAGGCGAVDSLSCTALVLPVMSPNGVSCARAYCRTPICWSVRWQLRNQCQVKGTLATRYGIRCLGF